MQTVTGPLRDLDVQLLEWDDVAGDRADELALLRALLEQRRARELVKVRRALRSRRFSAVLAAWRALASAPPSEEPRSAVPIEAVAADRIRKVYRRMVRDGGRIDDASPDEDLHELRKRGKELRYLLELFGSLFPSDVVKPLVRALKDLQDVLGRFQDRSVQTEMLRANADELAALSGGPGAVLAAGLDDLHARGRQGRRARALRRALRGLLVARAAQARARHLREGPLKVVATYSIKGGVGKTSAAVNLAALAAREGRRRYGAGDRDVRQRGQVVQCQPGRVEVVHQLAVPQPGSERDGPRGRVDVHVRGQRIEGDQLVGVCDAGERMAGSKDAHLGCARHDLLQLLEARRPVQDARSVPVAPGPVLARIGGETSAHPDIMVGRRRRAVPVAGSAPWLPP